MASITISNLDAHSIARLRVRATHGQRSIEEEARKILEAALAHDQVAPPDLAVAIRERFRPLGGLDLELPPRR
jgi:plasmid stability protein